MRLGVVRQKSIWEEVREARGRGIEDNIKVVDGKRTLYIDRSIIRLLIREFRRDFLSPEMYLYFLFDKLRSDFKIEQVAVVDKDCYTGLVVYAIADITQEDEKKSLIRFCSQSVWEGVG